MNRQELASKLKPVRYEKYDDIKERFDELKNLINGLDLTLFKDDFKAELEEKKKLINNGYIREYVSPVNTDEFNTLYSDISKIYSELEEYGNFIIQKKG